MVSKLNDQMTLSVSSDIVTLRLKELLADLTVTNFEQLSTQIVFWVTADPSRLTEYVQIIWLAAINASEYSCKPLASLCKLIYIQTLQHRGDQAFRGIIHQNCLRELESAKLMFEHGEPMSSGKWPQFVALMRFLGELFKVDLVDENMLLESCIDDVFLGMRLNDAMVEGLCAILTSIGDAFERYPAQGTKLVVYFDAARKYVSRPDSSKEAKHIVQTLFDLRANEWRRADEDETQEDLTASPTMTIMSDLTFSNPNAAPFMKPIDEQRLEDEKMWDLSRHDKYYLPDGNMLIICEHTLFRVHKGLLCLNSPVLRDKLSRYDISEDNSIKVMPYVHLDDTVHNFVCLLQVLYHPGFRARHEIPPFPQFSAIMRMVTKYEINDIKDQLLVDIRKAYPTSFQDYEASKDEILGEMIFDDPKPHPNAVLTLLLDCNVKFALPFAYYRACRRGADSLLEETPGESLSSHPQAVALRGLSRLKAAEWKAVKSVLFGEKKGCGSFRCYSVSSIDTQRAGKPIFEQLINSMSRDDDNSITDVLAEPNLNVSERDFCEKCLKSWSNSHKVYRESVWEALPQTFQLGSWVAILKSSC